MINKENKCKKKKKIKTNSHHKFLLILIQYQYYELSDSFETNFTLKPPA